MSEQIAGPTLFGVLLSSHGAPLCITVAAGIMAVTLPALVTVNIQDFVLNGAL